MTIRQPEGPPIAELVSFQFAIERDRASRFLVRHFGGDKVERVYSLKRPTGRFHHSFGWNQTQEAEALK